MTSTLSLNGIIGFLFLYFLTSESVETPTISLSHKDLAFVKFLHDQYEKGQKHLLYNQ